MSIYLSELSRELGKTGLAIDIFTRSTSVAENGKIENLGSGVRLMYIKAGPLQSVSKEDLPDYLPEFIQTVEEFRISEELVYHIIFSHYWISGLVGQELQEYWQVPHLLMFHTLGAVKNLTGIGKIEPDMRLETEKKLAQNCSLVIVPTEREKKELTYYYEVSSEQVSVIPCGVNLDRFRPISKKEARGKTGHSPEEKVALFVGRPDPIKGLEQLLKALKSLTLETSFRLVVIGGDEKEIFRWNSFCRDLLLPFPVTFMGTVQHQLMPYYYSAADLCVVPSYYESFGLAALEAMACGTPVVATDVGELQKIVCQGESGYLASSNDPQELAAKIEMLLTHPGGFEPANVRDAVSNYDWSQIAGQVRRKCFELVAAD